MESDFLDHLSCILNSPVRNASFAFGAHSRYVILPFSSTLKPNFSVPCIRLSLVIIGYLAHFVVFYLGEAVDTAFCLIDKFDPVMRFSVSSPDDVAKWGEPRIQRDYACKSCELPESTVRLEWLLQTGTIVFNFMLRSLDSM